MVFSAARMPDNVYRSPWVDPTPQWGTPHSIPGRPFASMGAEWLGNKMGGGDFVMGQMFPNQSMGDTLEARQFRDMTQGISQKMQPLAQQDVQDLFSGMKQSGIFTGDMTNQQRDEIAQNISGFLPMLNMVAPGMSDALGPGFASQSYAGSLAMAGRSRLQTPGQPGTGIGMTDMRDRISSLTMGSEDILQNAPEGYGQATRGFGRGRRGEFVRQAMQQGLGPGGDIFSGDLDEDTANLAQFERGVVKPMSAIRDLGGQFRNMNAGQMFEALDQITLGGTSRKGFGELEDQVRTFKQLTRSSGLSIDQGKFLQQMAGERAKELGGDFGESGTTAGMGAMAFGAAVGELGAESMRESRTSKMRLMQIDAILTAQAGESPVADQMAALMRMGEEGMLKKGSKAEQAFQALKAGSYKYMDEGEFREMLSDSGVDPSQAAVIRNQREHNQLKYGDKVTNQAREQQWELDIATHMQRTVANDMATAAGGKINARRAMQLGKMVTDTIRDTAGQTQDEVKKSLEEKFMAAGATEEEARQMASVGLGAATTAAKQKGFESFGEAAIAGSPEMLRKKREEMERAASKGEAEKAEAHKGQETMAERLVRGAKEGVTTAAEGLARLFGGVKKKEEDAAKEASAVSAENSKNVRSESNTKQGAEDTNGDGKDGDEGGEPLGTENNPMVIKTQDSANSDDANTATSPNPGGALAGDTNSPA